MTPRSVAVLVLTPFGVPSYDQREGHPRQSGNRRRQRWHQKGKDDD